MEVARARHARCFLDGGRPPLTDADAAELVNQRGFMLLGELPRPGLPSLSGADEEREWSVSWHAWRWKETLPAARACAYLKWFRGQGTFISWRRYPDFYALWGPELDATDAYRAGLLGRSELAVLSEISDRGPISSRQLWQTLRARLGRRQEMIRALASLQKRLFVSVSGGDVAGWSMHNWDLATRCAPDGLLDVLPSRESARRALVLQAVDNLVYCAPREVASLFGWAPAEVVEVARSLESEGRVRLDLRLERCGGACLAAQPPPSEALSPNP
jgi:hypothetical protein